MPRKQPATIRAAVVAAAERQGLGPYDLAGLVGECGPSKDQIWRYLTGRGDITTAKADALLRALGLSPPLAGRGRAGGGGE